jgi:hypothetical protein
MEEQVGRWAGWISDRHLRRIRLSGDLELLIYCVGLLLRVACIHDHVAEQTACERPTITVAMITYNHERFIGQAIESVLMQERTFVAELVIGEDCSTETPDDSFKHTRINIPT